MTTSRTNYPAQIIDELDEHIAESMENAEFRAASEDVDHRYELIEGLVRRRKELGLTQKDVALRMGVKQPTVSGFETEGSDPRLSTVQRYARAVEARCAVTVKVVVHCDWVNPAMAYANADRSKRVRVESTHVSDFAVAWARRSFALAA